jgi:CRP-like cAMP-binding protein
MHLFARKLVAGGFLRQKDAEYLISLCGPPRIVPAGANLFPHEHHARHATVILSGVACRYKMIADGRRQIVALLFPGEVNGLCDAVGPPPSGFLALRACTISQLQYKDLQRIRTEFPQIDVALWAETVSDIAIAEEWLFNIGQRDALERVAHLLCEIIFRHRRVGLVGEPIELKMPLTQIELADSTGLSPVHVNRTLNELRTKNIIGTQPHVLAVMNWNRLKSIGGFDPRYLQLSQSPISEHLFSTNRIGGASQRSGGPTDRR